MPTTTTTTTRTTLSNALDNLAINKRRNWQQTRNKIELCKERNSRNEMKSEQRISI